MIFLQIYVIIAVFLAGYLSQELTFREVSSSSAAALLWPLAAIVTTIAVLAYGIRALTRRKK